VITYADDALSKHAHSCSGIKWENLAALDFEGTFQSPRLKQLIGFVPYINTNVGQQNCIHLAPKNLGFGSPQF